MSNYYTKFSVAFSLPSKEAQDYAIELHRKCRELQSDCCENGFESKVKEANLPEAFDEDIISGFSFECEPDGSDSPGLWIHSEDGGIDAVLEFIRHLLVKFIPEDQAAFWRVAVEWSNDCDRPRLDAFGGGAAIVSRNGIKWMNTKQWIEENTPTVKA